MTKKALLVGINDYAPVGKRGPDLKGCINDVRDMAHTLNALEIIPQQYNSLHILTDSNATKMNILNELKWLIKDAKENDLLIFYYSGHGSQILDINGDEIDKQDETLCPHDFKTAGMIVDDDLREFFTTLPIGVNLEVILDCCFSGTGTRELNVLESIPEDKRMTYRYLEPSLEHSYFLDTDPIIPRRKILQPGAGEKKIVITPELNHVLWTAANDRQTSSEDLVNGVYRGIFTYCFCKVLRRTNGVITRRKLASLVRADVKRMGYSQILQLESPKDNINERVFGLKINLTK